MDPERYPLLFVLFFVGLWMLISVVISHVGGWQELAGIYSSADPFQGRRWPVQSGQMRWAGYNNALTVGANARGLHLSVLFLFRLGHPPLFIPWEEISAENKRQWLRSRVELRFARASGVPLVISKGLAERIAAEAGSAFRWTPPTDADDGSGRGLARVRLLPSPKQGRSA